MQIKVILLEAIAFHANDPSYLFVNMCGDFFVLHVSVECQEFFLKMSKSLSFDIQ